VLRRIQTVLQTARHEWLSDKDGYQSKVWRRLKAFRPKRACEENGNTGTFSEAISSLQSSSKWSRAG
jgi:hypothetical protein